MVLSLLPNPVCCPAELPLDLCWNRHQSCFLTFIRVVVRPLLELSSDILSDLCRSCLLIFCSCCWSYSDCHCGNCIVGVATSSLSYCSLLIKRELRNLYFYLNMPAPLSYKVIHSMNVSQRKIFESIHDSNRRIQMILTSMNLLRVS